MKTKDSIAFPLKKYNKNNCISHEKIKNYLNIIWQLFISSSGMLFACRMFFRTTSLNNICFLLLIREHTAVIPGLCSSIWCTAVFYKRLAKIESWNCKTITDPVKVKGNHLLYDTAQTPSCPKRWTTVSGRPSSSPLRRP